MFGSSRDVFDTYIVIVIIRMWWEITITSIVYLVVIRIFLVTPPKFNIAPEKWWLEDEFPFGIVYF